MSFGYGSGIFRAVAPDRVGIIGGDVGHSRPGCDLSGESYHDSSVVKESVLATVVAAVRVEVVLTQWRLW